ncbi:hypothetical protein GAMM_40060 [Gammaproteobacteria bacterium]
MLNPFLFLRRATLALCGIRFAVIEDIPTLYSWFFRRLPAFHWVPINMEIVLVPNHFNFFLVPTKTTDAILHNYPADSSDLQHSYAVKYGIQSSRLEQLLWSKDISEGNLNALTLKSVTINDDNIASLELHSHVTAGAIKITRVWSQQGLQAGLPVIIPPMGDAILLLSNCHKDTDYALETDYTIGDDKTGEYLHGMIWFRVPSDNEPDTSLSIPKNVQLCIKQPKSVPFFNSLLKTLGLWVFGPTTVKPMQKALEKNWSLDARMPSFIDIGRS